MELINFNTIANINCSKKENKEDEDKIFLYSDDSDKILINNQIKNQFRDNFSKMSEKLKILSLNVSNIIQEKKFSHKILLQKYTNLQVFKTKEDFDNILFKSNHDISDINNNNINNNSNISKNHNTNNINKINNLLLNNELNIMNSKSSNNSGNNRSFIEKKRKRGNNNNGNNEDSKKLFHDILNICQNISNLKNNFIEIKNEPNEIINENENIETTILCKDKEIATIYLNENIIQKIHINKNNKIFTEEKEISDNLYKIRRDLNKVYNKLLNNK